jgi:ADP-ribosylglycohydrolase
MLDRVYGCLIGTAIGDAMGMPASFMSPQTIKKEYGRITDFLKPTDAQVAHGNQETAQVTDDTEESLVIASVLIESGCFDEKLFVDKMRKWAMDNKMLDSTVIGPSTRRFLTAIINNDNYVEAGKMGDTNGGAMRVAPIGIFYHGNVDEAIKHAILSAVPSHGSAPGIASTAAVSAAISLAVEGGYSPREVMEAALKGALQGEEVGYEIPSPSVATRIKLAMEIVEGNRELPLEDVCIELYKHIGAGMKSYESIPLSLGVFYAAKGQFEEGLISVINIGDDADTNGAIVGAICGAYSGASVINEKWIKKVKDSNLFDFEEIAKALMTKSNN